MNTYTTFKCNVSQCKREFILLTEDLNRAKESYTYIVCPYCSSKNVHAIKETDSIRECMDHSTWKKISGVIKQTRNL